MLYTVDITFQGDNMMRERTNESGSVLVFIIVGLVLLAGLGTAVYYTANIDKGSTDIVVQDEPKTNSGDVKTETKNDTESSSEVQPEADANDTVTAESDLPQSGPNDAFLTIIALSGVSFALFSYLISRYELARRS